MFPKDQEDQSIQAVQLQMKDNNQRNNYWLFDLPLQIRPRNALINE
jgi:hypothetical protein